MELTFSKIDIASANPGALASFYSDVFAVSFKEVVESIGDRKWKMYLGELGGITLFICPAETSGIEENTEGVHQFHLVVSDLEKFVEGLRKDGHEVVQVPFGEGNENYCLRDPDGHPWILSSDDGHSR